MGMQEQRVLLDDCHAAANLIRTLLATIERLQSESAKDGEALEFIARDRPAHEDYLMAAAARSRQSARKATPPDGSTQIGEG